MKSSSLKKDGVLLVGIVLLLNILRIGEYVVAHYTGDATGQIREPWRVVGFLLCYSGLVLLGIVVLRRMNLRVWQTRYVIPGLIALGIVARLLAVPPLDENQSYDFVSWAIVAQIVEEGGNVYAETTRYNYGPAWFHVLHGIYKCAMLFDENRVQAFRYILVMLLSLADVGIFLILLKRYSLFVAAVFWFHPLSILTTGCHNQFDNIALCLGLWAMHVYGENFIAPLNRRKWFAILLLGVSLIFKHIFIFFPFWLAVKQHRLRDKVAILCFPVIVFVAGFLPYWTAGKSGIINNVFLYASTQDLIFYQMFVPHIFHAILSSRMVWIGGLLVCAVVFRRIPGLESACLYLCVMVLASPSLAGHYLVLAVPMIAIHYANPFFISYTVLTAWFFLLGYLNIFRLSLHFVSFSQLYTLAVVCLVSGLIWLFMRAQVCVMATRSLQEIRKQLQGSGF